MTRLHIIALAFGRIWAIAAPEEWRAIPGYEGLYEASSLGSVRSLDRTVCSNGGMSLRRGRVLRSQIDRYGYANVRLSIGGVEHRYKVHRLVCAAFHGSPPPRFHAGHIDHDKLNNVPANLAWISHSENARQNIARGIMPPRLPKNPPHFKGEESWNTKLTNDDIRQIRTLAADGQQGLSIARRFSVSPPTISKIINRRLWGHVE